jgi:hypothetical protein
MLHRASRLKLQGLSQLVSQQTNSGQQWSDESSHLLFICVQLTKRIGGVCQCFGCARCCAGMLQPSAGTAYIAGYDITTNMAAIRRSLGICPQVIIPAARCIEILVTRLQP